jgi:hypothetical protein
VWKDPIVEEIHQIRERMAREADYDLDTVLQSMRAREARHPGPVLQEHELAGGRLADADGGRDRKDAA